MDRIPLTDKEIDKAFEEAFTAKKVNIGVSEKDMEKIREMVSANTGVPKCLLEEKDNINPDHYKSSTSLECIEAMEMVFGKTAVLNFCMCNAWKYIWRWKHKNGVEDLNKAKWYIKKATKLDPFSYDVMLERMLAYIEDNNCPEEDGDK